MAAGWLIKEKYGTTHNEAIKKEYCIDILQFLTALPRLPGRLGIRRSLGSAVKNCK